MENYNYKQQVVPVMAMIQVEMMWIVIAEAITV
jgi:hypothetical protein